MKTIIGVLFFAGFLSVWAITSFISQQSQPKGADLIRIPQLQVPPVLPAKESSLNAIQLNLEEVSSIGQIEQQYVSFKDRDLRNELLKLEGDSKTSQLIKQANSRPLTKAEFENLAVQLRKISALHKILLDRALDEEDKSL